MSQVQTSVQQLNGWTYETGVENEFDHAINFCISGGGAFVIIQYPMSNVVLKEGRWHILDPKMKPLGKWKHRGGMSSVSNVQFSPELHAQLVNFLCEGEFSGANNKG